MVETVSEENTLEPAAQEDESSAETAKDEQPQKIEEKKKMEKTTKLTGQEVRW